MAKFIDIPHDIIPTILHTCSKKDFLRVALCDKAHHRYFDKHLLGILSDYYAYPYVKNFAQFTRYVNFSAEDLIHYAIIDDNIRLFTLHMDLWLCKKPTMQQIMRYNSKKRI